MARQKSNPKPHRFTSLQDRSVFQIHQVIPAPDRYYEVADDQFLPLLALALIAREDDWGNLKNELVGVNADREIINGELLHISEIPEGYIVDVRARKKRP